MTANFQNRRVLIHRDNGGTLVISQEGREIVLNLHRGNLKEFKLALDHALGTTRKRQRGQARNRSKV